MGNPSQQRWIMLTLAFLTAIELLEKAGVGVSGIILDATRKDMFGFPTLT